jgi:hypothetical protein
MAFDPRAYGAQVQSANQAYRARTGNMAPAQPQQTLATTQVQPTSALAASLAGSGRMRPNMNGAVTQMPAGYNASLGPQGTASQKNLLVGYGGVPMSNPATFPAFGQGFGAASFGQGGPQGGSALTGGVPNGGLSANAYGQGNGSVFPGMSPNQNMQGPGALPTQPWVDSPWARAKAAIGQPPVAPPAAPPPAPSFTGGGDWARQFFGSGMGGQYGTGNAMAKLQGWAQNNPEAVQRMRDTGLVPPADYYTRNR